MKTQVPLLRVDGRARVMVDGRGGTFARFAESEVHLVNTDLSEATTVLESEALRVSALGVPHNAPALAYRVDAGDISIVFSSDQNGTDSRFVDFARDATSLVMHFAVSEAGPGGILR